MVQGHCWIEGGENEITFDSSLWHSVPAKKLPVTVSQTLVSDAPGNCATTNAKGANSFNAGVQTGPHGWLTGWRVGRKNRSSFCRESKQMASNAKGLH